MWTVTTVGDLPNDCKRSEHTSTVDAWADYQVRILELEVDGFTHKGETAAKYGREWVSELHRGLERVSVTIDRTVTGPG
jgi:hypothetical protein